MDGIEDEQNDSAKESQEITPNIEPSKENIESQTQPDYSESEGGCESDNLKPESESLPVNSESKITVQPEVKSDPDPLRAIYEAFPTSQFDPNKLKDYAHPTQSLYKHSNLFVSHQSKL